VVRALAADQHGVLGRAQLLERGVSSSAIGRALGSGRLHRLHRGVYSLQAPELLTDHALLIAALMAAGRGAFATHGSAAWRWRVIPAPPTRIELAVPGSRAPLEGVALFRPQVLRPGDVVTNRGVRTTSVPRTVLDLAVRYELRAMVRVLEQAEFEHDLRPEDIKRTLRRGHPGSANLRAALDAHTPGHGQVKSDLERRFRKLLIKHGVELPLRNEDIGPYEVACGPTGASSSSSTPASTSGPRKQTATTTATCGCAAALTSCAATAPSSSNNSPTPSSRTCEPRSQKRERSATCHSRRGRFVSQPDDGYRAAPAAVLDRLPDGRQRQ
jgi:predicted transcriptional regulator of viral defense system